MKRLLLSSICALSLAAMTHQASAEILLRLSHFGSANDSTYANVMKPWFEAINEEAKGIIRIEGFPGGSLVPDPRAQMKAVQDGVVDIAFVVFSYTPGVFPDNDVMELPTLFRNVKESTHVIRTLYDQNLLRGFDRFYVPMLVTTYPYNFHTTKPVTKISDFRGMKLRAGGPVAGAAMRLLGVAPVGMPIPAVAENISRGVIDGTAADWNVLYSFRIADVAKHHYMAPFGTVPVGMLMTRERFAQLPQKAQEIIEKHSGWAIGNKFAEVTGNIQAKWLKATQEAGGHTITFLDDQALAEWDKTLSPITDSWVKGNERRQKILDVTLAELAKLRAGN